MLTTFTITGVPAGHRIRAWRLINAYNPDPELGGDGGSRFAGFMPKYTMTLESTDDGNGTHTLPVSWDDADGTYMETAFIDCLNDGTMETYFYATSSYNGGQPEPYLQATEELGYSVVGWAAKRAHSHGQNITIPYSDFRSYSDTNKHYVQGSPLGVQGPSYDPSSGGTMYTIVECPAVNASAYTPGTAQMSPSAFNVPIPKAGPYSPYDSVTEGAGWGGVLVNGWIGSKGAAALRQVNGVDLPPYNVEMEWWELYDGSGFMLSADMNAPARQASVPEQHTYVAMQSLQHIDFGWHESANGDTDANVVYSWGFWYNHYDITVEGDINFHGGASVAGAVHQPLIDFLIKLPAGKRVRIRPGMWAFRWATRRQAWPITDATLLGRYDAAVQFGGSIDDTTAVFVPYEVVADPPLDFDVAATISGSELVFDVAANIAASMHSSFFFNHFVLRRRK